MRPYCTFSAVWANLTDNVGEPDSIRRWLPSHGVACDVLLTTTWDDWDARWHVINVRPLRDPIALQLVAALSGDDLAKGYGPRIIEDAGGLPMQLCPTALALAKADRRGRLAEFDIDLSDETQQSLSAPWNRLDEAAQLAMFGALTFNPSRIDRDALRDLIESGLGERAPATDAVDACCDSFLLQGDAVLRMHDLTAAFVQGQIGAFKQSELLGSIAERRLESFRATAYEVGENPGDTQATSCLLEYRFALNVWQSLFDDFPLSGDGLDAIGKGLRESGLFVEARPWYERAVAEAEQGDVHGRVDHDSLGVNDSD